MRIGCLQFGPVKGDVNNNLSRADAVLLKENATDLDILVLPEMAFSGYHYKTLQEIHPHLEHTGSGISSLWARTTALKYDCTVVVGYPEKVDLATNWPASPEYYNSVIIVNGDGETVGTYRKSHLYTNDEAWALEGEGFYSGVMGPSTNAVLGVSMDINPYKFQVPWHAFEFAFHILDVEANLVIVTMAWPTDEDPRLYSRAPQEPDMDTLMYWISRFEPLIHREAGEEVIVVFANRIGSEDDFLYAGTSAVIGIHEGEVKVYGLLGRGDKELLVVDTDKEPYGKLVYRPDGEREGEKVAEDAPQRFYNKASPEPATAIGPTPPPPPPPPPLPHSSRREPSVVQHGNHKPSVPSSAPVQPVTSPPKQPRPPKPRSQPKLSLQTDERTLQEGSGDKNIVTPTCPSPTPMSVRPRFSIPPTESLTQKYVDAQQGYVGTPHPAYNPQSTLTPHPMFLPSTAGPHSARIYGGEVAVYQQPLPTVPEPGPVSTTFRADRTTSVVSDVTEFSESGMSHHHQHNNNNNHHNRNSVVVSMFRPGENQAGSNATARVKSGGTSEARRDEVAQADQRSKKSSGSDEASKRPSSRKSRARSNSQSDPQEPTTNGQRQDMTAINRKLEEISLRVGSASGRRNGAHPVGHPDPSRRPNTADCLRDQRLTRSTGKGDPGCHTPIVGPGETAFGNRNEPTQAHRQGSRARGTSATRTQTPAGKANPTQVANNVDPERTQSRGRPRNSRKSPPNGKPPSQGPERKSAKSASRNRSAQPIDLSQFQYIEEYPAADCPFHGSRPQSRAVEPPPDAEARPPSRPPSRTGARAPSVDKQRRGSAGIQTAPPPPPSMQRSRIVAPKMTNTSNPLKKDNPVLLPKTQYRSRSAAHGHRNHSRSASTTTLPDSPVERPRQSGDDLDLALAIRNRNYVPWVETWMPPGHNLMNFSDQSNRTSASSVAELTPSVTPDTPHAVPTPKTPRAMLIVYDSHESNRRSLRGKTLECLEKKLGSIRTM